MNREPDEDEAGVTGPDGLPVPSDTQQSESESKENQEEEEIQYTEEEEAIKNNLESEEPLPAEVLDNILQPFWQKEPFKLVHLYIVKSRYHFKKKYDSVISQCYIKKEF